MTVWADALDQQNEEILTGYCGSAALSAGLCKSNDFRALVSYAKISDALLYAIVLQMGLPDRQAYLLLSSSYTQMRRGSVESFKHIPQNIKWVFVVPEEHGRMTLLIDWNIGLVLYFDQSGKVRDKRKRSPLKVCVSTMIPRFFKLTTCARLL